ncbi:MAG: hypothetical protein HUU55_19350 [Myxococcales bacterium]|nr:hypothetical protein [Myxococcales bacterium]
MKGLITMAVVLTMVSLNGVATVDAQSDKCSHPPEFVGVPTGEAAFSLTGEAVAAGAEKYLHFGDELVVSGGEGGFSAVSLYAENECGLWLQHAKGDSLLTPDGAKLQKPTFTYVKATKSGHYRVEALGLTLEVERVAPGRFRVVLKSPINVYHGE